MLLFLLFLLLAVAAAITIYLALPTKTNPNQHDKKPLSIGFLHPHPLSGGGGERVLWCALLAAHNAFPDANLILYSAWTEAGVHDLTTAIPTTKRTLLQQFGLDIGNLSFLPINLVHTHLIEPSRYPRLTLLLQALGAARLGAHAYRKYPVDVFVDTANLTFSLILPRLLGAKTVSYVHYPTISTDMLSVVSSRKAQFNNDSAIAKSALLSYLKLLYYKAFAHLYALAALFCDIPLANSSWTYSHLSALWWNNHNLHTIFPPCPSMLPNNEQPVHRDPLLIVSIGQFRPEKNHALQLDILSHLQSRMTPSPKLLMIGGTRNAADDARVKQLQADATKRNLPVQIQANASRAQLEHALATASVGLHTMRDEHFGISVAELQAHGLVVVAHGSGGVKADIVQDGVSGLLAEGDAREFAQRIEHAMSGMSEAEREEMRREARRSAGRFSDEAFRQRFANVFRRRIEALLAGTAGT